MLYGAGTIKFGWRFAATGTYYLRLRFTAGTGYPLPTYTVTVEEGGPDDYPDAAAGAPLVPLGTAVVGSIQFNGDKDFVSFAGTAGHIYRVSTQATSYLYVSAYDSRILGDPNAAGLGCHHDDPAIHPAGSHHGRLLPRCVSPVRKRPDDLLDHHRRPRPR
jgi:hypothetical protein